MVVVVVVVVVVAVKRKSFGWDSIFKDRKCCKVFRGPVLLLLVECEAGQ